MPTRTDLTEADLQAQVVELAHILGWEVMHVRRSIGKGTRWTTATSVVGWPDLFFWRRRDMFAAELKSAKGKLTSDQEHVLRGLGEAGLSVFVWRPEDWDQIQRVLEKGPRAA